MIVLSVVVEKTKRQGPAVLFHDPAQSLLRLAGEGMRILKNHQLKSASRGRIEAYHFRILLKFTIRLWPFWYRWVYRSSSQHFFPCEKRSAVWKIDVFASQFPPYSRSAKHRMAALLPVSARAGSIRSRTHAGGRAGKKEPGNPVAAPDILKPHRAVAFSPEHDRASLQSHPVLP